MPCSEPLAARRRGSAARVLVGLLLALAALASLLAPATARAATAYVAAKDNFFDPDELHVAPGDTVAWKNVGLRAHTVTSDAGLFNSGNLQPGDTFSRTFRKEGYYFYHCVHHGSPKNGMWGVVVVGHPPPLEVRPKIVVPDDYATIQRAVNHATPGTTVIVRPGTYRESVVVRTPDLVIRGVDRFRTILNGGDGKTDGILVDGLGQVRIRNLTIKRYLGSGIFLRDVDDYAIRRVDLIKDRTYGVNADRSYDGVIADVFAWGSGDSAVHVAHCFACSTIVDGIDAKWSFMGFAGVNVTGVVVRESRFVHNGAGIVLLANAGEELAPGAGAEIVGNTVVANNYETIPAAGLSAVYGIPFGTGIWIAGSANATISANDVHSHDRYGILVSGAFDGQTDPANNAVLGNLVRGTSGFDLAWEGRGWDDCFQANDVTGNTGPPDIQTTFACSARPFVGTEFEPVLQDVDAALVLDPSREQIEPPDPLRPRCQRGRPGCR